MSTLGNLDAVILFNERRGIYWNDLIMIPAHSNVLSKWSCLAKDVLGVARTTGGTTRSEEDADDPQDVIRTLARVLLPQQQPPLIWDLRQLVDNSSIVIKTLLCMYTASGVRTLEGVNDRLRTMSTHPQLKRSLADTIDEVNFLDAIQVVDEFKDAWQTTYTGGNVYMCLDMTTPSRTSVKDIIDIHLKGIFSLEEDGGRHRYLLNDGRQLYHDGAPLGSDEFRTFWAAVVEKMEHVVYYLVVRGFTILLATVLDAAKRLHALDPVNLCTKGVFTSRVLEELPKKLLLEYFVNTFFPDCGREIVSKEWKKNLLTMT